MKSTRKPKPQVAVSKLNLPVGPSTPKPGSRLKGAKK